MAQGIFGRQALGADNSGIFGSKALGAAPQGVFGNQALGAAPQGVFGNQALGAAPQGVFDNQALGGIFAGPTALGTALGLGGTSQNAQCKMNCVSAWSDHPDSEYNTLVCQQNCDYNYPPETTLEPEGTEPWYVDPPPQSVDTSAGLKCSSPEAIRMVQMAIGAAIDGKWGPESQKKLQAAGGSFKAFAPSCEGPVPSYSGGGGVLPPATTPPATTPPATTPPAPAKADVLGGLFEFMNEKFMGLPVVAWAGVFTVVVAGAITVARLNMED